MDIKLWSDEYFVDKIERTIKMEISMKFIVSDNRRPTKEEYEKYFEEWKSKIKCVVTDYDLGIFQ